MPTTVDECGAGLAEVESLLGELADDLALFVELAELGKEGGGISEDACYGLARRLKEIRNGLASCASGLDACSMGLGKIIPDLGEAVLAGKAEARKEKADA